MVLGEAGLLGTLGTAYITTMVGDYTIWVALNAMKKVRAAKVGTRSGIVQQAMLLVYSG